MVDVRERLGVREVGERDGALGGAPDHSIDALGLALDPHTFGHGAMDHEALGDGLGVASLVHEARHLADDVAHAVAGDRAHPRALPLDVGVGDIRARADDDAGPLEQVGLVAAELVEQHPLLLRRRAALGRREVDEHDEHSRALDVAQEAMTEPPALARALDQAGDVRDDHLEVVVERARRRGWARGS